MKPRLNFFASGPVAMQALASLNQHLAQSGLDALLMELVGLRASQINGCAFCIDRHMSDARKAGEAERRLAMVAVWRETPFFTDRERAALEWTEAVTSISKTHAPDSAWEQVRAQFEPAELVNLTLLITTVNAWNRFAIAFRKMPS